MVDVLTKEQRSIRMSRVRHHGTAPELSVRKACRDAGMRYTTGNRDLPGSPDIANRTRRWAIFVHGCFWHRHSGCRKATMPGTNVAFWKTKLDRNVERDGEACLALRRLGYSVLVVWECQTERPQNLSGTVRRFMRRVYGAKEL